MVGLTPPLCFTQKSSLICQICDKFRQIFNRNLIIRIRDEDEDDEDEDKDEDEAGTRSGRKPQRTVTEALLSSTSVSKKRARASGKEPVRMRGKRAGLRRTKQHRIELLYLLGQCMLYNEQCDNHGLQSSFVEVIPEMFRLDPIKFTMKEMRSFLKWFQLSFAEIVPPPLSNTRCTALGRLPGIVESRKSCKLERVQVFVIMLRSMHIPARLVMCLFPREKAVKKAKNSGKKDDARPHVWVEVWMPASGEDGGDEGVELLRRWVHVSVNEPCGIDTPGFYHAKVGEGAFTIRQRVQSEAAYIVALSQFNYAMDVTLRYSSRPSVLMKRRCTSTQTVVTQFHTEVQGQEKHAGTGKGKPCWWEGYVLGWLRHAAASMAVMKESAFESASAFKLLQQAMSQETFEAERKELRMCARDEQVPTSEAAFRHHAMFVLEKHLRKHEAVDPSEQPVTFFKGQKVFRRSAVDVLFSRKKWKLAGRMVKAEELDHPMKQWKWQSQRRKGEEETTATVNLYAKKQTNEMQRPALDDGKLPRNQYGNIEIYCDKMVPLGTTVLDHAFALKAAKQLNVDYLR